MKIKNQFCPYANIQPGEQENEEHRAWQGAPSIERTKNGRLFVAFMSGGIYEPDPRNCIYLITSEDNGDTWSKPILVLNSVPSQCLRVFEGELWMDPHNRLWLIWCCVPYKKGLDLPNYDQVIDMENDSEYHQLENQSITYASICDNPDADELVFSEPFPLFNAVCRNKPYVISNRWIFPSYLTGSRPYHELYITEDEGKHFHTVRIPGRALERAYDEPTFWQTPTGILVCVFRTTPHIYTWTFSYDHGDTWTQPTPMMATASERPCSLQLKCGKILLIPSIKQNLRNGLRILVSEDGIHFTEKLILDDRERISYPEAIEGNDEMVYIVYDRERNNKIKKSKVTGISEAAKEVLFARIPTSVIFSGVIDDKTIRARVITKAKIDTLQNEYTQS